MFDLFEWVIESFWRLWIALALLTSAVLTAVVWLFMEGVAKVPHVLFCWEAPAQPVKFWVANGITFVIIAVFTGYIAYEECEDDDDWG